LAQKAGFVKRSSRLTAEAFMQLLLYCSSLQESSSLAFMASVLEDSGIPIRKQSLDERFNSSAVDFVKAVLREFVEENLPELNSCPGDFGKAYNYIRIKDSTKFKVPDNMQEHFKGCGGSEAGMSIQYEYDLKTGKILDLRVYSGDRNDLTDTSESCKNIQAGDLVIRDLGYYNIEVFEHFKQEKAFFPSKLKSNTNVYDMNGKKICFKTIYREMCEKNPDCMQLDVYIGKEKQMPVRMILYPVDEQTYQKRIRDREKEARKRGEKVSEETRTRYHPSIFITNTTEEILPADKIYLIYKLRWQIELMFKSWKSTFCIHETRKMKEDRYLCLLHARLLLIVINTQIVWRMQGEMDIRNRKGKVELLSFNKALRTLSTLFKSLYTALWRGKQAARKFFLHLRKKLASNHQTERRKHKTGLNEIIELFICESKN
jgi:hypothetical protein